MSFYRIEGGRPLSGSLSVQGAKNSVLPILAAAVLARVRVSSTTVPTCPTYLLPWTSCAFWAAGRSGRGILSWWMPLPCAVRTFRTG